MILAPLHFRRRIIRPVSYYALFKCVAASKPTSWLFSQSYILLHLNHLGDLSCGSGLFPFWLRNLSHAVWLLQSALSGIQSLIGFSNLSAPSPFSALPPVMICNASPKAISGRTSYIRVRLEFLRYPQLIPAFFNIRGFGPPPDFTLASTCPWVGHSVSGRIHATLSPYSDSVSLRLRTLSS